MTERKATRPPFFAYAPDEGLEYHDDLEAARSRFLGHRASLEDALADPESSADETRQMLDETCYGQVLDSGSPWWVSGRETLLERLQAHVQELRGAYARDVPVRQWTADAMASMAVREDALRQVVDGLPEDLRDDLQVAYPEDVERLARDRDYWEKNCNDVLAEVSKIAGWWRPQYPLTVLRDSLADLRSLAASADVVQVRASCQGKDGWQVLLQTKNGVVAAAVGLEWEEAAEDAGTLKRLFGGFCLQATGRCPELVVDYDAGTLMVRTARGEYAFRRPERLSARELGVLVRAAQDALWGYARRG